MLKYLLCVLSLFAFNLSADEGEVAANEEVAVEAVAAVEEVAVEEVADVTPVADEEGEEEKTEEEA